MNLNQIKESLDILGIPSDVNFTKNDIISSYKHRSKFYHPDMNKVSDAHKKFIKLKDAYDFLINDFDWIKASIKNNPSFFNESQNESNHSNQDDHHKETTYENDFKRQQDEKRRREEFNRRTKDIFEKVKREAEEKRSRQEEMSQEKQKEQDEAIRKEQEKQHREELLRKQSIKEKRLLFKMKRIATTPLIIIFIMSDFLSTYLKITIPLIVLTYILNTWILEGFIQYYFLFITGAIAYIIFIVSNFDFYVIDYINETYRAYRRRFIASTFSLKGIAGIVNVLSLSGVIYLGLTVYQTGETTFLNILLFAGLTVLLYIAKSFRKHHYETELSDFLKVIFLRPLAYVFAALHFVTTYFMIFMPILFIVLIINDIVLNTNFPVIIGLIISALFYGSYLIKNFRTYTIERFIDWKDYYEEAFIYKGQGFDAMFGLISIALMVIIVILSYYYTNNDSAGGGIIALILALILGFYASNIIQKFSEK